jgi:hypothetical protein
VSVELKVFGVICSGQKYGSERGRDYDEMKRWKKLESYIAIFCERQGVSEDFESASTVGLVLSDQHQPKASLSSSGASSLRWADLVS